MTGRSVVGAAGEGQAPCVDRLVTGDSLVVESEVVYAGYLPSFSAYGSVNDAGDGCAYTPSPAYFVFSMCRLKAEADLTGPPSNDSHALAVKPMRATSAMAGASAAKWPRVTRLPVPARLARLGAEGGWGGGVVCMETIRVAGGARWHRRALRRGPYWCARVLSAGQEWARLWRVAVAVAPPLPRGVGRRRQR